NRTATTGPSGASTYEYAEGTSRLTRIDGAGAISFAHNANGNITSKGYQVFVYNADDRLSQVRLGNNQQIAAYVYDLQGKRIRKHAGQTRSFHYDQDGHLIAETDDNGNLVRGYVRLDGLPLAMVTADGSIYSYHTDHLGTPLRLTDSTGAVVWAADYQPFGRATLLVNTVENNLRFPGQYFDTETGLHYNLNRYYDPDTGRYLTPDPIGLEGGVNVYAYVNNDPVNWVDPWGLFNPTKGLSAIGNAAIAGFSAGSGTVKILIAAGASPAALTGVGALPPTALAGWAAWNFKSSKAAWDRAVKQTRESLCEDWGQSSLKNFYGMLPHGTEYDDSNDKYTGPLDYITNQGWYNFLKDSGIF
ncbi:RHS repeat-associated core domain-containing protein, partial [Desulfobulbus elongatus]|uniref:RHS repeat-associated core domain-containing protein n=1 Tax=Desulfobulbus elongatus TaxID=53332 RepID=UPI000553E9C0